jgi:hypothetical protein
MNHLRKHHSENSFPGSAWERDASQAPPADSMNEEAEPRGQCVPRRSLGTSRDGLNHCTDSEATSW